MPCTVLYNANVITMNGRQPRAEAVGVQGDKIAWIGKIADIEESHAPSVTFIDCQGKTLIPGFNDAHCHIFAYSASLLSLDLSPTSTGSIEDIKLQVKKRARELPLGPWIRGTGYNEFYLKESRHPNRWDLDETAPKANPVILTLSHQGRGLRRG